MSETTFKLPAKRKPWDGIKHMRQAVRPAKEYI